MKKSYKKTRKLNNNRRQRTHTTNKKNGGGGIQSVIDSAQHGSIVNDTGKYMQTVADALRGTDTNEWHKVLESSYKLLNLARVNPTFPFFTYNNEINIIYKYFHETIPDKFYDTNDVIEFVKECIKFKTDTKNNNNSFIDLKYSDFLTKYKDEIDTIDFTHFLTDLEAYVGERNEVTPVLKEVNTL